MSKTLTSIRVSEETFSNIHAAIAKHNEKSLVKLNFLTFRRLAYEVLSQTILQGKELNVKLE